MLNVIKMDLYRLMRSKSFRIGLIIAFSVCFLAVALSAGLLALVNMALKADPTMAESADVLVSVFSFLTWENGVDLSVIVLQFSGILCLAISTVLSAIFVSEEQTSGFGKNYLGQLSDKGTSAISKVIATSIISMSMVLVCTLSSALAGALFFGKCITGINAANLALAMFLRLLMYLSINAIIVFVSLLTKNKSASMVIGVVFGIGASKMAYGTVTYLLQFLASRVLKLSDFEVPSIAGLIPDGVERMIDTEFLTKVDGALIARVLIVAAVYICGFTFASFMLVRKRDVK